MKIKFGRSLTMVALLGGLAVAATGGTAYAAYALTGADIVDNTLTGADVNESSLKLGCLAGTEKGWAKINTGTLTSTYAAVTNSYNCAGMSVRARSLGTGVALVRFESNPAIFGVATNNADGLGVDNIMNDNVLTVAKVKDVDALWSFRVQVRDIEGGGTTAQHGVFVLSLV